MPGVPVQHARLPLPLRIQPASGGITRLRVAPIENRPHEFHSNSSLGFCAQNIYCMGRSKAAQNRWYVRVRQCE
jgi:hypothetical protein